MEISRESPVFRQTPQHTRAIRALLVLSCAGLAFFSRSYPATIAAQSEFRPADSRGALRVVTGFPGMVPTGPYYPPDPVIAVGPAVIAGATNHGVDIFDKQGALLARANLRDFFASVRTGNEGLGDPRVVFDPWSQQFLVHAHGGSLPCRSLDCPVFNFVAVSKSPNPVTLGERDWHFYRFDARRENSELVPSTIDYVRLGVNHDAAVLVGSKRDSFGTTYMVIRILKKADILAGSESVIVNDIVRFAAPGSARLEHDIQPAIHMDRSEVFFLISTRGDQTCGVVVWGIQDAVNSPKLVSRVVLPANPPAQRCSRPPNARQPDGAPNLYITDMPTVAAAAVYRNGSLWAAHMFQMDFGSGPVSAVRLMQIDVSQWPESANLVQDIVLGEDGVWSFMPAIGVSRNSDVAIVFARSSAREYPSAYIAGRLGSDPANTLRPPTLLKAGAASQTTFESEGYRWGDYFAVSLDPLDDSAWVVGEYTESESLWGTWIGRLDRTVDETMPGR